MIRVAVIDDRIPPALCPLAGDWRAEDGFVRTNPDPTPDAALHGATCLRILRQYAGDCPVEWHAFSLLKSNGRGDARNLVAVLDACRALGVRLVQMSVGSWNPADRVIVEPSVRRLLDAGATLVASVSNQGLATWPACLPGVLGVVCDPALTGDVYRVFARDYRGIDFAASSRHVLDSASGAVPPGTLPPGVRTVASALGYASNPPPVTTPSRFAVTPLANSFATPVISAHALRILAANPSFDHTQVACALSAGASPGTANRSRRCPAPDKLEVPAVVFNGYPAATLHQLLPRLRELFARDEYDLQMLTERFDVAPRVGEDALDASGNTDGVSTPGVINADAFAYVREFAWFTQCGGALLGLTEPISPHELPDACVFVQPGADFPDSGDTEIVFLRFDPGAEDVEGFYARLLAQLT